MVVSEDAIPVSDYPPVALVLEARKGLALQGSPLTCLSLSLHMNKLSTATHMVGANKFVCNSF